MVIYALKQNFVIRPSLFKGNEKGLDKKNPTKFCFRSILGCMLKSHKKLNKNCPIGRGRGAEKWHIPMQELELN